MVALSSVFALPRSCSEVCGSAATWLPLIAFANTLFAVRYADQNERDYRTLMDAIRSGRLKVAEEQ